MSKVENQHHNSQWHQQNGYFWGPHQPCLPPHPLYSFHFCSQFPLLIIVHSAYNGSRIKEFSIWRRVVHCKHWVTSPVPNMRAQNLETSFCNIIINNEFALCDQKAQVLFSLTVILDIKSAVNGKLKTVQLRV